MPLDHSLNATRITLQSVALMRAELFHVQKKSCAPEFIVYHQKNQATVIDTVQKLRVISMVQPEKSSEF